MIAYQSARFHAAMAAVFGGRPLGIRSLTLTLLAAALFGAMALLIGAFGFLDEPRTTVVSATKFFAIAIILGGWLSLLMTWQIIRLLGRYPSLSLQACLLLTLLGALLALWLALMHAGTWFEWQERRTPVGYGSEWFYAEVYNEYLREPRGIVVSLTAALTLCLPAAVWVAWLLVLAGMKILRPLLEPLSERLLAHLERTNSIAS